MKLRTKIDVNFNSGVTGTATGIVEGTLQDGLWLENFNKVGANFTYSANGQEFYKNAFLIEGENIQLMYDAVKGSIPEGLDFKDEQKYMFYLGFMFEMANTFGIKSTDIEIVS